MLQRLRGILALGLLFICAGPALAQQSAQARATANVDLAQELADVQADPARTEKLFKLGAKTSSFCSNCHGAAGSSSKPEVPNLAAQNPSYLLEQLRQFADGRRRFEFMEGLIKAMTSDEKIGIVLYYSAQPAPTPNAAKPELIAQGKEMFKVSCSICHGNDGHGNHQLARIAGQQVTYLENTLRRYRDAQALGRSPRTNASMAKVTSAFNDAEIKALVAYVSSMP